jgi:hypothetical protein
MSFVAKIFGLDKPKLPAPAPAAVPKPVDVSARNTADEKAAREAAARERERLRTRTAGHQGTILTSPVGVGGAAPALKRTLGGSSAIGRGLS